MALHFAAEKENYDIFHLLLNYKGIKVGNGPLKECSSLKRELIVKCLDFEPESRHSFDEILFAETNGKKLKSKQQSMKNEIDARVMKIEAYEFQNQND